MPPTPVTASHTLEKLWPFSVSQQDWRQGLACWGCGGCFFGLPIVASPASPASSARACGDALLAGDAGTAFLVFECREKRQLLHPQLHRHHPAGVWGDAWHAGDAGTAFLVFECREKRQLLHPPLHRHHPAGVWGDAWHAGDAELLFGLGRRRAGLSLSDNKGRIFLQRLASCGDDEADDDAG